MLHVVDITHANALAQAKSVQETLIDIGAGDIPIITALNKIDALKNIEGAMIALDAFLHTYPISAKTGQGLDDLLMGIENELFETFVEVALMIPYQQGQIISLLHEHGQVTHTENLEDGTYIEGLVPRRILHQFEPYYLNDEDLE